MGEDSTPDGIDQGSTPVDLAGILEFAMSEWGKDPDWILDNWTDDFLDLMIRKHNERIDPDQKKRQQPLDIDRLKAASLARYKAWKQVTRRA